MKPNAIEVLVTVRGEAPFRRTVRGQAGLEKLYAQLVRKYGDGAFGIRLQEAPKG